MIPQGLEVIENVRRRYDGERRNAWNEAECGHHYARALASWTPLLALSGFHYDGAAGHISAVPRINRERFSSFWSAANAWGTFSQTVQSQRTLFTLAVEAGALQCPSIELGRPGT